MRTVHFLALVSFLFGLLPGAALAGVAMWGDLEASLFDFDTAIIGEASLRGLRCPVFITPAETGIVSVSLTNPLDRPARFTVRARITAGSVFLQREQTFQPYLQPGEKRRVKWNVTAKDAAYGGRLILVRVYQFAKYPYPSRDASCGIWVVQASPLTGSVIEILLVVGSQVLLWVGLWLWHHARPPAGIVGQAATYAIRALAALVVLALVVSLMGWWGAGLALIGIIILTLIAVVAYVIGQMG